MRLPILPTALLTSILSQARSTCAASNEAILAGQHVVYSFPSNSQPPSQLLSLTRQGLVGGVILFGENVDDNTPSAMAALKQAYEESPAPALLKQYTGGKHVPFLVTTDQEGGQVRRIKPGAPVQSAKQVGAASDPAAAGKSAGQGAASILKQYENNGNLAPVLGVYRHEDDFLDYYQRSYGSSATAVSRAAIPFIQAQQAAGVAATAKHFPGLGAASHSANTDLEPVTLEMSLSEIRSVDEVPFQTAINAGVDMVMGSWAIYPALDARPAGLSNKWMKDELRDRLGFTGVTITDAMEAGAVQRFGTVSTTAKLATKAGMDILLASGRDVSQGDTIRKALVQGLQDGELNQADFNAATARIAKMRSKLAA